MINQQILRSFIKTGNLVQVRNLQTTESLSFIQKWRKDRGLPMNPTRCGLLVDGPDFTYLDGRLTPYGVKQKKRILQERQIVSQIVDLSAEIDFAIERHKQLEIAKENKKQNVLDRKLKPKGVQLLKSK